MSHPPPVGIIETVLRHLKVNPQPLLSEAEVRTGTYASFAPNLVPCSGGFVHKLTTLENSRFDRSFLAKSKAVVTVCDFTESFLAVYLPTAVLNNRYSVIYQYNWTFLHISWRKCQRAFKAPAKRFRPSQVVVQSIVDLWRL
jgi:hypothetical protein